MAITLGPINYLGSPEDVSRLGTKSPFDFAYWASTFIVDGEPSDYSDMGPEISGAPVVSYAANQVGVEFPADYDEAIAYIATSRIPVSVAMRQRGTIMVNTANEFGICMGMRDAMTIIDGRWFLVRRADFDLYQATWLYGAYVPGMVY